MSRLILVYAHGGKENDPGAVNEKVKPVVKERDWIKGFFDNFVIPELKSRKLEYVTVQQEIWWKIDDQVDDVYKTGDIAISCHLNAGPEGVGGTETLFCKGSVNGEKLANLFNAAVIKVLGTKDRGNKGIQWDREKPRLHDDRGGRLVCGTKPPCILMELFFVSNAKELENATKKQKELAKAFVDTYVEFRTKK